MKNLKILFFMLILLAASFGLGREALVLDHVVTDFGWGCQYYNITNAEYTDTTLARPEATYRITEEKVFNERWEYLRKWTEEEEITIPGKLIGCEEIPTVNGTIEECEYDKPTTKTIETEREEWSEMMEDFSFKKISTTQLRYCAEFAMEKTERGYSVKIDMIPRFNGYEYKEYAWFDTSWGYKTQCNLTSHVSAGVNNIPMGCTLDTAALIAAGKMNGTNCKDLRAVNSAESSVIPYEIEACNTTNTVVWSLVNKSAGANDTIYIYYGNPAVDSAESPSVVWADYDVVYHMAESSWSGTALDSAGYDTNGTYSGTGAITIGTDCKWGRCADLDTANDRGINFTAPSALDSGNKTVLMWANRTSTTHPAETVYALLGDRTFDDYLYLQESDKHVHASLYSAKWMATDAATYTTDQRHFITMRLDSTDYSNSDLGVDENLSMDTTNSLTAIDSRTNLMVADMKYVDMYFIGYLDEFRLASTWFSDDYLHIVESQSYSLGSEETVPPLIIDSCRNITSSGYYNISQNITASGTCIWIKTNNVTLDGHGYHILGDGTGDGAIVMQDAPNTLIRNVTINGFVTGISTSWYNNSNSTVDNSIITNMSYYGLKTDGTDNVSFTNNVITNCSVGGIDTWGNATNVNIENVSIGGAANGLLARNNTNLTITNLTIYNTTRGVLIRDNPGFNGSYLHLYENTKDIEFDISALSSFGVSLNEAYLDENGSMSNYTNLTLSDTLYLSTNDGYSFTHTGYPGSLPTGRENIGRWVTITAESGTPTLASLTWHYDDSEAAEVDEDTLTIYKYSGGSWYPVSTTLDTTANTLTATSIVGFSDFGIVSSINANLSITFDKTTNASLVADENITNYTNIASLNLDLTTYEPGYITLLFGDLTDNNTFRQKYEVYNDQVTTYTANLSVMNSSCNWWEWCFIAPPVYLGGVQVFGYGTGNALGDTLVQFYTDNSTGGWILYHQEYTDDTGTISNVLMREPGDPIKIMVLSPLPDTYANKTVLEDTRALLNGSSSYYPIFLDDSGGTFPGYFTIMPINRAGPWYDVNTSYFSFYLMSSITDSYNLLVYKNASLTYNETINVTEEGTIFNILDVANYTNISLLIYNSGTLIYNYSFIRTAYTTEVLEPRTDIQDNQGAFVLLFIMLLCLCFISEHYYLKGTETFFVGGTMFALIHPGFAFNIGLFAAAWLVSNALRPLWGEA